MTSETVRQCVVLPCDDVSGPDTAYEAQDITLPLSLRRCGGRPLLAWSLREMQRFGIDDVVLLVRRSTGEIERAVAEIRDSLPKPVKIALCIVPADVPTGEALHRARAHLQPRFLLFGATTIFSFNLSRFIAKAQGGAWILLRDLEDMSRCGEVELSKDGERVSVFPSQANSPSTLEQTQRGLIWSGISLLDRSILDHFDRGCSIEHDFLPQIAQAGDLRAMALAGFLRNISVADDLGALGIELSEHLLRPAVFLDRDGVINSDHGWVGTRERFEWEPGVLQTIGRLSESGHHVFIVTNQSGIARGFYDEDDLKDLMDWVIGTIRAYGGTIDDWRYCPMHPQAPLEAYRGESDWRKPAPGMLLDLIRRWELTPSRCVLFGDQQTDLLAAHAAGMEGVKVGPESLAELVLKRAAFR